MKEYNNTLSEKDRRHYAAILSEIIRHGGDTYIAGILGCSRKTVYRGRNEIKNLSYDNEHEIRNRRTGGGRKGYEETIPHIDEKFLHVLKCFTAGDPMNPEIIWTNLTQQEISNKLFEEHHISVSRTVIKKLLNKHKYRQRKALKCRSMKHVENRDDQFKNIVRLKSEYQKYNNPIISMDTKKREYLGNYYREGYLYTKETIEVWDHDFDTVAEGVVIPHGLYDVKQNVGFLNLGTSKDTSEFACDNIRDWWYNHGKNSYSDATSILILCDCGGSNGYKHYIFKEDLERLVNSIGIEIRIAHYPPYSSKYNPIEHRLFPHVTRACQGMIFRNIDIVKSLMEKAKTKTGLKVNVKVIEKEYKTGRKYSEKYKENMHVIFDDYLSEWNYRVIPENC